MILRQVPQLATDKTRSNIIETASIGVTGTHGFAAAAASSDVLNDQDDATCQEIMG